MDISIRCVLATLLLGFILLLVWFLFNVLTDILSNIDIKLSRLLLVCGIILIVCSLITIVIFA